MHDAPGTVTFLQEDTLEVLPDLGMPGRAPLIDRSDTLIYLDPPYLPETRKSGDLYDFELSFEDHERLLSMVSGRPSMVMISGYRSPLYDRELANWTRVDYRTQTRRGMVDESLWMNFAPPVALHDYSHLGDNFRERERIKRKKSRWKAKIRKMDRQERLAIMDALTGLQEAG